MMDEESTHVKMTSLPQKIGSANQNNIDMVAQR